MLSVGPVPPPERETIDTIRRAVTAEDGQDPLDEAAEFALTDDESLRWSVSPEAFVLVRDDQLELAVHPEARRRGHGGRLATAALAEVATVGTAWSHGDHPGAAALASRHGFKAARALWVMRRPTPRSGGSALPEVTPPEGVVVRGFGATGTPDRDADQVVAVNAAAFAGHPEQGAMSRADFERRRAEPWFEADGLILAERTSEGTNEPEMLGFHWTKRHDQRLGEVYVVGIAPAAQGMGLGSVLTLAGLHHLAEVEEILLYVESDNAPAISVYSRLGFTHAENDTHVQYARSQAVEGRH